MLKVSYSMMFIYHYAYDGENSKCETSHSADHLYVRSTSSRNTARGQEFSVKPSLNEGLLLNKVNSRITSTRPTGGNYKVFFSHRNSP